MIVLDCAFPYLLSSQQFLCHETRHAKTAPKVTVDGQKPYYYWEKFAGLSDCPGK
jgi:hypothetical protein